MRFYQLVFDKNAWLKSTSKLCRICMIDPKKKTGGIFAACCTLFGLFAQKSFEDLFFGFFLGKTESH